MPRLWLCYVRRSCSWPQFTGHLCWLDGVNGNIEETYMARYYRWPPVSSQWEARALSLTTTVNWILPVAHISLEADFLPSEPPDEHTAEGLIAALPRTQLSHSWILTHSNGGIINACFFKPLSCGNLFCSNRKGIQSALWENFASFYFVDSDFSDFHT